MQGRVATEGDAVGPHFPHRVGSLRGCQTGDAGDALLCTTPYQCALRGGGGQSVCKEVEPGDEAAADEYIGVQPKSDGQGSCHGGSKSNPGVCIKELLVEGSVQWIGIVHIFREQADLSKTSYFFLVAGILFFGCFGFLAVVVLFEP